jgi:hypothetical protein
MLQNVFAQKTFTVTDSLPVVLDGLKAGYIIKDIDLESKKNNQSKYKIYFYLTNTSNEAKIMYKNPGFFGHFGPITNIIALFKCANATGARLTNKMASMELQPCKLEADVEDKDCNTGKTFINKRIVDIGFWIKPGETIFKTYPMYVPQNEKPSITITFYSEPANQTGNFITTTNTQQAPQEFVKIKNVSSGNYLNNQSGLLNCSSIDMQWWSAQWEILPIINTNNFQIKNHWKNNFLSTKNNTLMSDNGQSPNATWTIEESAVNNFFYIKNVTDNSKLIFQNGQIKTSNTYNTNDSTAQWIIEK